MRALKGDAPLPGRATEGVGRDIVLTIDDETRETDPATTEAPPRLALTVGCLSVKEGSSMAPGSAMGLSGR